MGFVSWFICNYSNFIVGIVLYIVMVFFIVMLFICSILRLEFVNVDGMVGMLLYVVNNICKFGIVLMKLGIEFKFVVEIDKFVSDVDVVMVFGNVYFDVLFNFGFLLM